MGAQHHPHFLQHVLIVIDADVVETNRRVDSPRFKSIERQHAAAQAKIRAAIVADARVRLLASLSRSLSESQTAWPSVVFGPRRPKRSMIVHRRSAVAAASRIFLLVGRLDEVHVDGNAVFLGAVGEHCQPLVGAPLQVRRRELDLDALLAFVLGAKMVEQRDGLRRRHLKTAEILG